MIASVTSFQLPKGGTRDQEHNLYFQHLVLRRIFAVATLWSDELHLNSES